MEKIYQISTALRPVFLNFIRIAIALVMIWIGGLKAFQYEADGIVPFVINSPFMSFFYQNTHETIQNEAGDEIPAYTKFKNPEGKTVQQHIDWHQQNGTYIFSYGLGLVIVVIGLTVLMGIWFPTIGFWGGILTVGMSLVTLSFLITTPEVYVPNLGGDFPTPQYGFPYLSGAGRLVLKDIIMLAAGLLLCADSAERILNKKRQIEIS